MILTVMSSLHTMLSWNLAATLSVLLSLGGARPGKLFLIETQDQDQANVDLKPRNRNHGSKPKLQNRKEDDFFEAEIICKD